MMCPSSRILATVILLLFVFQFPALTVAQQTNSSNQIRTISIKHELRIWDDLTGKHSTEARFEFLTQDHVTLTRSDGQLKKVKRGILSKKDQTHVAAIEIVAANEKQDKIIEEMFSDLVHSPEKRLAELQQLHRMDRLGDTLPLFAGVVLATHGGKQKFDEAIKCTDKSLLQSRTVAAEFPASHTKTFVSALNNRAVLALRDRQASTALRHFSQIIELDKKPPTVPLHNINLFLKIATENPDAFDLKTAKLNELREAATKFLEQRDTELPQRFLYSTEYVSTLSTPDAGPAGDELVNLRSRSIWVELTCFFCKGNGYLDCPRCVKGIITIDNSQAAIVPDANGIPVGTVFRSREHIKCADCKGAGGFVCPHCHNGVLPLR